MQRNKDIKNLSEITKYCSKNNLFINTFGDILKEFDLKYINVLLSKSKFKGVDSAKIFQILFILPYFDIKNICCFYQSRKSQQIDYKKDVFYDFMRNSKIDWRNIMYLFVKQLFKVIENKSVADIKHVKSPTFYIVDDSLLEKSGKTIEKIGKVYDHCSHTYSIGMKILTFGFWDGKSFIPLDFSIHNEPGKTGKRGLRKKDLDNQFSKERNINSAGYKRVQEVTIDKINMSINMICNALNKKIVANYVLADSWFISEPFLTGIKKLQHNIETIGLMKTNRTIEINAQKYNASAIPEIKKKEIQYSKTFKCHYIKFDFTYKSIAMRGFWVRMKGQNSWKLLITTDTKLSFIATMKYYQVRWSIEVFFKDCKQNLGLNNCQSVDLDAYFAHISIVMMNYMVLNLKKRFEDYETLGGLFKHSKELILEQTLVEKIWDIIIDLYLIIFSELGVDLDFFIQKMIQMKESIEEMMKNTLSILSLTNKKAA
jgi:hypothetical protein